VYVVEFKFSKIFISYLHGLLSDLFYSLQLNLSAIRHGFYLECNSSGSKPVHRKRSNLKIRVPCLLRQKRIKPEKRIVQLPERLHACHEISESSLVY